MNIRNFEFKARTNDLQGLEKSFLGLNPVLKGIDCQTDTYFNVSNGRLKLREGNIENSLIFYKRTDISGSKQADIILYRNPDNSIKEILTVSLGIKAVVNKIRKIYFIDNVKFHFDTVEGLGTFIEVEAIDEYGDRNINELKEQCEKYFAFFGLKASDYESRSYSDLILDM